MLSQISAPSFLTTRLGWPHLQIKQFTTSINLDTPLFSQTFWSQVFLGAELLWPHWVFTQAGYLPDCWWAGLNSWTENSCALRILPIPISLAGHLPTSHWWRILFSHFLQPQTTLMGAEKISCYLLGLHLFWKFFELICNLILSDQTTFHCSERKL